MGKDVNTLSLYELNSLVRQVIDTQLSRKYWVEAELSDARESRGHCYMELIEKDALMNTPIARASAKCWHSTWMLLQPHFERVTGQRLHAGMKVRLQVYAQFHEAFGFSWIVTDIDPNYTLGDMARRRQEIIRQLKEEGVFDLQKELELPLFCLRIAVISSATAAGYGDFCNQLAESGFAFQPTLFPAIMQGEQVEQSIIGALDRIYAQLSTLNVQLSTQTFDCVVIIRGGGATADMSGFDTLALAENVAQFPLPIITGIGHDRDESILDMVSYQRVKTPTAAAAFLIDHAQQVLDRIDMAEQRIAHMAQLQLSSHQSHLATLNTKLATLFQVVRTRQESRLERNGQLLAAAVRQLLEQQRNRWSNLCTRWATVADRRVLTERHRLELLQQRVKALDPQLLLQRGYSITLVNGKTVRNAAEVKSGDQLETRVEQGTIISVVK